MRQFTTIISIRTHGCGLIDVTPSIQAWVGRHNLRSGLLTLFCRHTSASLIIQENAAPGVRADLEAFLERIAPEDPSRYVHNDEGADDMPAHIRAMLTGVYQGIPLIEGALALGTWQGIYLFEHRRAPHRREIALHLIGRAKDRPCSFAGDPMVSIF
jgi:secondary thiamine-phosphate synthase enzyme